MNSTIFNDTMIGLLEAIEIQKGKTDLVEVPNMPVRTFRAASEDNYSSSDSSAVLTRQQRV